LDAYKREKEKNNPKTTEAEHLIENPYRWGPAKEAVLEGSGLKAIGLTAEAEHILLVNLLPMRPSQGGCSWGVRSQGYWSDSWSRTHPIGKSLTNETQPRLFLRGPASRLQNT
jgi:hypothetical protein